MVVDNVDDVDDVDFDDVDFDDVDFDDVDFDDVDFDDVDDVVDEDNCCNTKNGCLYKSATDKNNGFGN